MILIFNSIKKNNDSNYTQQKISRNLLIYILANTDSSNDQFD